MRPARIMARTSAETAAAFRTKRARRGVPEIREYARRVSVEQITAREAFGDALRTWREAAGLTRAELEAATGETTRGSVARWEYALGEPTEAQRTRLAAQGFTGPAIEQPRSVAL